MKIKFLLSLSLLFSIQFFAVAQNSSGTIQYEVRIDVHRRIPKEREEMKAMIPQFRTENFLLTFNEQESLYKVIVNEEEDINANRGGGRMMFRMPKTETHISKLERIRTVQTEFMGKNYLILDTMEIAPWKIGNEQMEIAGYLCQMAYYTDSSNVENVQEITAWFALQLPPFNGPEGYVTLPGTVLALDINNGERAIIARKIDFKSVEPLAVKKPEKGEVITRANFNTMMRAQIEKMRASGGMRMGG